MVDRGSRDRGRSLLSGGGDCPFTAPSAIDSGVDGFFSSSRCLEPEPFLIGGGADYVQRFVVLSAAAGPSSRLFHAVGPLFRRFLHPRATAQDLIAANGATSTIQSLGTPRGPLFPGLLLWSAIWSCLRSGAGALLASAAC